MGTDSVTIVECPRDAWQGLPKIIPTEVKATYLLKLIEAGFHHLDAVSFVAPKLVPQMADSEAVLEKLVEAGFLKPARNSNSSGAAAPEGPPPAIEIIGIVVNKKGLERAMATPGLTTIGYPYSISAHFRRANANMTLMESRKLVWELNQAVLTPGAVVRSLVVYISMAFGNPYDEPWGPEIVEETLVWLRGIGVETVSLADTVGSAEPQEVGDLFRALKKAARGIELGVHLHSRPEGAAEKVLAAYEAGCRRFDSALTGLGGCPFAGDELVGNIPTEIVVSTLAARGVSTLDPGKLLSAVEATKEIRKQYVE